MCVFERACEEKKAEESSASLLHMCPAKISLCSSFAFSIYSVVFDVTKWYHSIPSDCCLGYTAFHFGQQQQQLKQTQPEHGPTDVVAAAETRKSEVIYFSSVFSPVDSGCSGSGVLESLLKAARKAKKSIPFILSLVIHYLSISHDVY